MNLYKGMIYKIAEEKQDPFRITKTVAITNLAGIPADMALNTAIELGDIKRTMPKGIKFLKHLATPEVKKRMAEFASKQLHTGLPMSAGLGAIITMPVAIAEYMKYKKDKLSKVAGVRSTLKKALPYAAAVAIPAAVLGTTFGIANHITKKQKAISDLHTKYYEQFKKEQNEPSNDADYEPGGKWYQEHD